jgi:hypothetical protein
LPALYLPCVRTTSMLTHSCFELGF